MAIRPNRKRSANGNPNRKRTWVAPTVPSVAVSSRCAALRTVWLAAAMTVNNAHSQEVPDIATPNERRRGFNIHRHVRESARRKLIQTTPIIDVILRRPREARASKDGRASCAATLRGSLRSHLRVTNRVLL